MSKSIIDQREVQVLNEEGDQITYRFELSQAEEVCQMLIYAVDAWGKRKIFQQDSHYTGIVLGAQAEMIEQGLHLRGVRAPDLMLDIEAFHKKFGLEYDGKPRMLEPQLFEFRRKFMDEERFEWEDEQEGMINALTSEDGYPDHRRIALGLHQQLDALVDLVYVALGTAYLQFGAEVFHEAWRRVQEANMAKERCEKESDSKRGSTFDVIKPQGWTPPDHHDLVKDHAHCIYRHGAADAEVK